MLFDCLSAGKKERKRGKREGRKAGGRTVRLSSTSAQRATDRVIRTIGGPGHDWVATLPVIALTASFATTNVIPLVVDIDVITTRCEGRQPIGMRRWAVVAYRGRKLVRKIVGLIRRQLGFYRF